MTGNLGDRGVSEGAGVAALVLLTVLVTASVGINVLFLDGEDEEGVNATFSFQYREDGSYLPVTHQRGDPLQSDRVFIQGPDANTT